MNNLLLISLIVLIFGLLYCLFLNFESPENLKQDNKWQINYLQEVYPMVKIKKDGPIFFEDLEFIFTFLLPEKIIKNYKENSYKASVPGPSCEMLPCPCDKNDIPDVKYDPDPIWENKWPPCNMLEGVKGIPEKNIDGCCKSIENYKKCLMELKNWNAFDTWQGAPEAEEYNPPEYGQLWKPALFPLYTGLISKYPKNNWNSFYNKNGDKGFVEIIHSYFPSEEKGSLGVWFYKAKGSGILLNLGKTFVATNKIHALILLKGLENTVNIIKDFNISFWIGNGLGKNLEWILSKFPTITLHDILLIAAGMSSVNKIQLSVEDEYLINRMSNTGALDGEILKAGMEYTTFQFTVQPNLYPGWTTEILYKGKDNNVVISNIINIPKDQIIIFGPKNELCNFSYPFRWLYCDKINPWLNPIMDTKNNPKEWEKCSTILKVPYK